MRFLLVRELLCLFLYTYFTSALFIQDLFIH